MRIEWLLDQLWVDVVAAANDQVFRAPREKQAVVLIQIAKVTGVEPTILDPGIVVVGLNLIACEHLRAFD